MKVQFVNLGGKHILVVDGVRGPLGQYGQVVTHPAGLIAYPADAYGVPAELKGRVFLACPHEIEMIDDSACTEATKAYEEWTLVQRTCTEVKLARYGAESEEAK